MFFKVVGVFSLSGEKKELIIGEIFLQSQDLPFLSLYFQGLQQCNVSSKQGFRKFHWTTFF